MMFNSINPVEQGFIESLARSASLSSEIRRCAGFTLGMEAKLFGAARPAEIPEALERIAAFRPQALYVALDTVLVTRLRQIAAFALKRPCLRSARKRGHALSDEPAFLSLASSSVRQPFDFRVV